MNIFQGNANQTLYPMLDAIVRTGISAVPRGRSIRELLHAVTILDDPRERVLTVHGRRANPFFQVAETVWILAGSSEAEWLLHFNSQMEQFLDLTMKLKNPQNGAQRYAHFHGAYGERMRRWGDSNKFRVYGGMNGPVDQLDDVIEELKKDPDSRRAVMIFGNPEFDQWPTNDRPCNIAFAFKLRDRKLHMTTFNRSNDVVLGLTFTNIVQFTTIQEVVASQLNVGLGPYYHYSDSLHLYRDDPIYTRLEKARRAGREPFDVYRHVRPVEMRPGVALRSIEKLFRPLEARDGNYAMSVAMLDCPYWRSVGRMILAYDSLKRDEDFDAALSSLEMVEADDWLIACLEYLVRWVKNRFADAERDHRFALIGNMIIKRQYDEAVWRWVFYEGMGEDAA